MRINEKKKRKIIVIISPVFVRITVIASWPEEARGIDTHYMHPY